MSEQQTTEQSTILIVDDQIANRMTLEALLAGGNYRLLAAGSGAEALRKLAAEAVDLVLLDVMMPEQDGYEICATIRATPRLAELPVVMVTALDDQQSRLRGIEAGADDFISKPFDKDELRARVRAITRLNRYRKLQLQVERVRYLERHDTLTGLPNREQFTQRLNAALDAAGQWHQGLAVLAVGIARFGELANALGTGTVDALVREQARRLERLSGPAYCAARIGDDKFAVLFGNGEASADAAAAFALRVRTLLEEPLEIDGQSVIVGAPVGISLFPNDSRDPGELLDGALSALGQAQYDAGGAPRFFSAQSNAAARRRLHTEIELRRALDNDELFLVYQPKVDLVSGCLTGVEALVRWRHPERGVVAPGEFIPIAEKSQLIKAIADRVTDMACAQMKRWRDAGAAPARVAVNISGQQFQDPGFADRLAQTLDVYGVPPSAIELELTESILMPSSPETGIDEVIATLRALKTLGVYLSIDDFGTGYSSLSYLTRFPVDALKIDGSFVANMFDSISSSTVTKTVIGLAHTLGLCVVAEGVEHEAEKEFLAAWNCNEGQGFLFCEPVSAAAIERILRNNDGVLFPAIEACA